MGRNFLSLINSMCKTLRNHLTNSSSHKNTGKPFSLGCVAHGVCDPGLNLEKIPSGILSGKSIETEGGECESRSERESRAGPERRVCSPMDSVSSLSSHFFGPGALTLMYAPVFGALGFSCSGEIIRAQRPSSTPARQGAPANHY